MPKKENEDMKPWQHAKNSSNKWGGKPEDYIKVHNFFDQTKSNIPDMRHRAILHSSLGIFLAEQALGVTLTNSEGRVISVRDIGEDHVFEDLGFIPTVEDWLKDLPLEDWMMGSRRGEDKVEKTVEVKEKGIVDLLKEELEKNSVMPPPPPPTIRPFPRRPRPYDRTTVVD